MNELQKFLELQQGLREISLCIVDNQSLADITLNLEQSGYVPVSDMQKIAPVGKQYIIINNQNIDDVYSLIAQYRSGAWVSLAEQPIIPDYEKLSVIAVIEKNYLETIENNGRDVLSKIGMTIQL